MKILLMSATVLCLFMNLSGCAAHRLSIEEGVSKSVIYELDEHDAFNIAYSSIQEVFPQENVSVITNPARGYITKFLAPPLHVDWFTQKILIHRSEGTTPDNRTVLGYWIEVSGSGSSFLQGQMKNAEVFDKIIKYFETSGTKHVVSNIRPAPYLVPKEEFYVKGADYLEGKGTRVIITSETQKQPTYDEADRIRKLHDLLQEGIITKEEFEAKKKRILK